MDGLTDGRTAGRKDGPTNSLLWSLSTNAGGQKVVKLQIKDVKVNGDAVYGWSSAMFMVCAFHKGVNS